jgi:hypothetical protein
MECIYTRREFSIPRLPHIESLARKELLVSITAISAKDLTTGPQPRHFG